MRKLPLLIVVLACLSLTGCDWWDHLWGTTPPKPPVVVCRCAPALRGSVAPAPKPVARRARHRHRHHARYAWHKRDAERSVDIYDYSSRSRAHRERPEHARNAHIWADGYGRRHLYDDSAVAHYTYEAHQRHAQQAQRLDPWHGYNDDWD